MAKVTSAQYYHREDCAGLVLH